MSQSIFKMLTPTTATSNIVSNTTDTVKEVSIKSGINLTETLQFMIEKMSHSPYTIIRIFSNIIEDNHYAIFLFTVMTVLIFTIIIRFTIYLFSRNGKSRTLHIGRRIVKMLFSRDFIWTGLLLGITLGIDVLDISDILKILLRNFSLSILLWIVYSFSKKIINLYFRSILIFHSANANTKLFRNKNILIVLYRALLVTWFLIIVTILLGIWGVELGPILAGLGIAGIVVGLALQDTLSHIVGGISLMLDEAYSEGDYIALEDGKEGIVFQIGYRSTRLRTFDEEIIMIPNGVLAKMIIRNLSQPVKRVRVTKFYSTLASDASPEEIKRLLIQATLNISSVLRYPEPYVFFIEPKGNLFIFRLNFYIRNPINKLTITDLVQQEIVKLFHEKNITFGIEESFTHINPKLYSKSNLVKQPFIDEKFE
ncbi:MAG: mechanosensitive ion channel family protein [Brevinemataceae bacterium]